MLVNDPSCNLNLCDNDRKSPLMLCVQSQYYNCMGILLRKGWYISWCQCLNLLYFEWLYRSHCLLAIKPGVQNVVAHLYCAIKSLECMNFFYILYFMFMDAVWQSLYVCATTEIT